MPTRLLSAVLAAAGALSACRASSPAESVALDAVVPDSPGADAPVAAGEDVMTVDEMIARAKTRDYWPDKTTAWKDAPAAERQALLATPACKEFKDLVLGELKTDGVMVVKGGRVFMEEYTGGYKADPTRLHSMWSASKSFTAAVVGAVAEQSERLARGEEAPAGRLTSGGAPIGLSTPLRELLTDASGLNADPRFAELTVEHFLAMAPNLTWSERYEDDIQASSIAKMLWLEGYRDMARFAADQPFGPEGAGNRFIYSSGNALILMRALQDAYGSAYDSMPWDVLFDRIGVVKAAFERDRRGVFVGSSYVHTTLRDMAKFGYLYLNGGWYKDRQVVHADFVRKARELSIGMRAPGTTDAMIKHEEAFYGLGFWINPSPKTLAARGVRQFGADFPDAKFFPNVPEDAFFAAGHYGQNVLIFPKDDLLVVRFSHDKEYWSKLDRMMSTARRCFAGAN